MNYYDIFQILITFFVAVVYLIDLLKPYMFVDLYNFIKERRDIFIGIYYLYLVYELYKKLYVKE
jgi:hypothetical protein